MSAKKAAEDAEVKAKEATDAASKAGADLELLPMILAGQALYSNTHESCMLTSPGTQELITLSLQLSHPFPS